MARSTLGLELRDLEASGLDLLRFLQHAVNAGLVLALMAADQLEGVEPLGPQQPEADAAQRPGFLHAGDEALLEVQPERQLEFVHAPGARAVVPELQRPLIGR